MFVINPNRLLNLHEYGITIPLLDTRFINCTKWVKKNVKKEHIHILKDPIPLSDSELSLCHDQSFIESLKNQPEKEIIKAFELIDSNGFYYRYNPKIATRPLSEMVNRISSHIRGSILTTEMAINKGFCFFMGGGLHHSMSFGGRGFCLINDIVLSIRLLQKNKKIKTAWVIDVDAHKGDGTAQMTRDDDSIVTFSIHMDKGWPLVTSEYDSSGNRYPWFIKSDLDIGIDTHNESNYLKLLKEGLQKLKNNYKKPDLVIINSGSDPFEKDELETANLINLSEKDMLKRDLIIYNFFKEMSVPQAYLMSGGYGEYAHIPYINFFNHLNELGSFS